MNNEILAFANDLPLDIIQEGMKEDRPSFEESLSQFFVFFTRSNNFAGHNTVYNCNVSNDRLAECKSSAEVEKLVSRSKIGKKGTGHANLRRVLNVITGSYYSDLANKKAEALNQSIKESALMVWPWSDNRYKNNDNYWDDKTNSIRSIVTNEAYLKSGGVMFFDIDWPGEDEGWTDDDRLAAAKKYKEILHAGLKQYDWYLMTLFSTSKKGIHIWTASVVPDGYNLQQRILYFQNTYYYKASIIADLLGDDAKYIDFSLARATQGLYLSPTDSNPYINTEFCAVVSPVKTSTDLGEVYMNDTIKRLGWSVEAKHNIEVDTHSTINKLIKVNCDGGPWYFGHDKMHDGIPYLAQLIGWLLSTFSLEDAIEIARKKIYHDGKRPITVCEQELIRSLRSMATYGPYDPVTGKGYRMPNSKAQRWFRSHLNLISVPFEYDEIHFLNSNEYLGTEFFTTVSDFMASDEHILKIVSAPASGKTEAVKKLIKTEVCDVVEPFNGIVENKFSDFYQVTSRTKNPYVDYKSCIMIPDQLIKHDANKDLLIVDEIHEIWSNSTYRDSCAKFTDALQQYKKVILLTGTPQGEDTIVKPDRVVYFHRDPIPKKLHIIRTQQPEKVLMDRMTTTLSEGSKVACYANHYFSTFENVLRGDVSHKYMYIHRKYNGSEGYNELMETHQLGDADGIIYTKLLGCGSDITDVGKIDFYTTVTGSETGAEIDQAVERFRRADKEVYLLVVKSKQEKSPDLTEALVEFANKSKDQSIQKMFASTMLRPKREVFHVTGGDYQIDHPLKDKIDSVLDYLADNNSIDDIVSYLETRGYSVVEDVSEHTERPKGKKKEDAPDIVMLKSNLDEAVRIYSAYLNYRVGEYCIKFTDGEPRIENDTIWVRDVAETRGILSGIVNLQNKGLLNVKDFILDTDSVSAKGVAEVKEAIFWYNYFNDHPKELDRLLKYKNMIVPGTKANAAIDSYIRWLLRSYLASIDSKSEEEKFVKYVKKKLYKILYKIILLNQTYEIKEQQIEDPIQAFLQLDNLFEKKLLIKKKEAAKKKITDPATGEIYESCIDAAKKLKISVKTVTRYIKKCKLIEWNE